MDVRLWLKDHGLEEHAEAFDANGIDAELLPDLTNDDLKELGVVRLGDRKRLIKAIERLAGGGSDVQEITEPAKTSPALSSPSQISPKTSLSPSEGDRRQLTIFFADLSGYTELSDEIDAEDLHRLVGLVFDDIDRIVANHGGTVHRHIGDEVMALFGTPISHSDDPFRAVCAALETHKAMAALSARQGREIDVHVGIASGSVVIAGQGTENPDDVPEYAVTGVAANLAARLNSLAESNDTIISDEVYQVVKEQVDCESIGEVKVKGLAKPVHTWRAKSLYSKGRKRSGGIFIGRHAESTQFRGALESCRSTGNGQAVLLRGEAGMGKSRLVEEFESTAENLGFDCHKGLIFDFGVGEGHDAIRTLVYSLLNVSSGSDLPARVIAAENAITAGLCSFDQQMFLNDLLNLPLSPELKGLYDALGNAERIAGKHTLLTDLVHGASKAKPRLIVVEDVHWADAELLADLAQITAAAQDCPAIIVMTSRIEGDPLDQTWRNASGGNSLLTLDIGPLRQTEAAEFASRFTSAIDEYTKNCIKRAGGNPLFLEQLLQSAEESKEDEVPATIQSLVMARIDRLYGPDKQALQAASAIGQRFTLKTLQALVNDSNYSCAQLVEHQLVRPEGDDFLFAHALIQEGVYASLLKDKRARIHRQAAEWFASRDPVLRAKHLDRAEDPIAPTAYLEAANLHASAYRFDQALLLLERGLELAKETVDKFELARTKGNIFHDMGLIDQSIETYRGILDMAGNDSEKCRALLGVASGLRIIDRHEEALEILDQAEAVVNSDDLILEKIKIHHLRGNLYFPMGRIEECAAEHEKSLELARLAESAEAEANALSGLGDASYVAGHMATANQNFNRCVEIAKQNEFDRIEIVNLSMTGFTRTYLNQLEEALVNGLETISRASKIGHKRAEMMGEILSVMVLFEMQDFENARQHNNRGFELSRQLGAARFEAQCLFYEGKLYYVEGRHDLAVKSLETGVEVSKKVGHGFTGARLMGGLSLSYTDPKAKRDALDEGVRLLEMGSVSHNHFHFYPDAIEISLELEDWDNVEMYCVALETYTKDEFLPWSDFYIDRGRVLSKWQQGNHAAETKAEIGRLCQIAQKAKLNYALSALNDALAEK